MNLKKKISEIGFEFCLIVSLKSRESKTRL